MTGAELTDEIQALTGSTGTGEPLVDTTRCTRWLNEGQKFIAEEVVGIRSLHFKNTTSLDTTQVLQYAISDITVGDTTTRTVCHLLRVYHLNGNDSMKLTWIHQDEFDDKYPDPTHTDIAKDRPTHWTRRGQYVELFPLCQTSYCDDDLRFDGYYYPADFSTDSTEVSDITNADEGLIYYGCWKAQEAIGKHDEAIVWQKRFTNPYPNPGEDFGWLERYRDKTETEEAWSGNMFDDELM